MNDNIKQALNDLENIDDDWTDYDEDTVTEQEQEFANDIFDLIQSEVDKSNELTEEFTGQRSANKHFDWHCLGTDSSKKSRRSNVFYDFKDVSQYIEYEHKINNMLRTPDMTIASLLDTELVLSAFEKLFEGNTSILFSTPTGFKNTSGSVMFGIHSYSSDVTTNYEENTIDFIILTPRYKTVTLYAVSSSYVETKFNNIIKKYNELEAEFKINKEEL